MRVELPHIGASNRSDGRSDERQPSAQCRQGASHHRERALAGGTPGDGELHVIGETVSEVFDHVSARPASGHPHLAALI